MALAAATRPHLAGRGAIERRRRVQIDGAIEVGPVLVHVVGADEQALDDLALRADRHHLAARIHELVGIVRQQVEVQPVLRELRLVEGALARAEW